MTLPRNMRVRSKVVILLLLPITIFLWLIGWSLFWTGSRNKLQRTEMTAEIDTRALTEGILLENYEYNT